MKYADVKTLDDAFAWLAERGFWLEVVDGRDDKRGLGKWKCMVFPGIPNPGELVVCGWADTSLEALREAIRGWEDLENNGTKIMKAGVINWGKE